MKVISKPFTQIDRNYMITSAELRKALNIEGEIVSLNLYEGRSPNDEKNGKSPEKDIWEIQTREIKQDIRMVKK